MDLTTWFNIGLVFLVCISVTSFYATRHFEKDLKENDKSWIAQYCIAPVFVTLVCVNLSSGVPAVDLGLANKMIGIVIQTGTFYLFVLQLHVCIKSWYRYKRT
jgi:uncharacterized membrane protein